MIHILMFWSLLEISMLCSPNSQQRDFHMVSDEVKALTFLRRSFLYEGIGSNCKTYLQSKYVWNDFQQRKDAVEQAISECIREGILADFLMKNRAEAKKVSIYEYDEVKHMRQTREEGYGDGYNTGFDKGYDNCQDRLNLLNLKLYNAGRTEDLIKAAGDKAYQQSLFEEFGL